MERQFLVNFTNQNMYVVRRLRSVYANAYFCFTQRYFVYKQNLLWHRGVVPISISSIIFNAMLTWYHNISAQQKQKKTIE